MPYKGLNRLPVLVKEILNMVQVKQWQESAALTAAVFGWSASSGTSSQQTQEHFQGK